MQLYVFPRGIYRIARGSTNPIAPLIFMVQLYYMIPDLLQMHNNCFHMWCLAAVYVLVPACGLTIATLTGIHNVSTYLVAAVALV